MEAVVISVPLDIFNEVLVPHKVVHMVFLTVSGNVVFTKDVGANTSEEYSVSACTHFV